MLKVLFMMMLLFFVHLKKGYGKTVDGEGGREREREKERSGGSK
jgi:hypothetical protein